MVTAPQQAQPTTAPPGRVPDPDTPPDCGALRSPLSTPPIHLPPRLRGSRLPTARSPGGRRLKTNRRTTAAKSPLRCPRITQAAQITLDHGQHPTPQKRTQKRAGSAQARNPTAKLHPTPNKNRTEPRTPPAQVRRRASFLSPSPRNIA